MYKSLNGIVEHGENYEVSALGHVRNASTGKILKGVKNHRGYLRVSLMKNSKPKHYFIHKLVALAFLPNPENKPQVNHKDGVKSNNHVDNLEWATRSENMVHAYETGLEKKYKGEDSHKAKLTNEQVVEIKKMLIANVPFPEIEKKFNISNPAISSIKTGRTWSHVHVEGFTPTKGTRYSKYSDELKEEIRSLYASGNYTQAKLGDKFGIPTRTVSAIIRGA